MIDIDDVAAHVLALVGRRAEAAVTVVHQRAALTRFANSFIHQNVDEEGVSVRLEVSLGGRGASLSTTRVDAASLSRFVDDTLDAAALRDPDPMWPGVVPAQPVGVRDHWDEGTAEADPDRRAAIVAAFVDAGGGFQAAGFCSTEASEVVMLNSAGQAARSRSTLAAIDGVHRSGTSDGVASRVSGRLADLDGAEAGALAAAKARSSATPLDLSPGRYEVVLEPRCVGDICDFFVMYGFNAKAVQDEMSFVHLGEEQLDASISLWDDAGDARTVGHSFDAEGTPKRRTDLVTNGRMVGLTHDRRTAKRAGVESTGHAVPRGESFGAVATNLFMGGSGEAAQASNAADPSTVAAADAGELITAMKRGLLVSDLWYTRVLDPKTQVVTGLTRNGLFLVEDGQIVNAVANLRFTQSYAGALGPGKVITIGSEPRLIQSFMGLHHVPSLRLAAWNFTGGSKG
jgi:predicted Zn-dependent protease